MTIIITDDDVARHLTMGECIGAMATAFRDFAAGDAVNLPRARYQARHPDPERRYFANVHVGAVPSAGLACVRAGSQIITPPSATNKRRFYENPRPFNWGIVILFDIETAEPLALMHEFHLSGMRVGATSGLAVDRIAPKDVRTLGLFGTGKQAGAAFDAITSVREFERVTVFSPDEAHRADFVARKRTEAGDRLDVIAADGPEQVVRGADVVCCCTTSMVPVFDGAWLADGQLVISIANSDSTNRKRSEVDEVTYGKARTVVVNDWESVIDNDQTELLEPLEAGLITREQIVELGDIVAGTAAVRAGGGGIVYYKNNSGLAIQFAAAGRIVYDRVKAEGTNRQIPTEWLGTDLGALYRAGFRPSP
jgi:ornithine cyclodeaminase/alanine dehydrogenase-like protein (mu-crystallin family)